MRAERGGRPVEGARLFKAMRFNGDATQASEHVGFVPGRLSPLTQKEFTKRGWQLVESVTIARSGDKENHMSFRKLLLVGLVALGGAMCATALSAQTGSPGPVLPLPPADAQKLAANLGAGVVGAALPSEQITDASAYFPLNEKTFVFQVTSGSHTGNTQNLVLKKARRPGGNVTWRFNFAPSLAAFISPRGGDLIMPAISDVDEGVIVVTTPANPFVLTGMKPGGSSSFRQKVAVNYLDDPTKRDWGGRLNATYTYVGTYSVTVPAGTFPAILIRFAYKGKVGPADVVYTAWYFFARDVGLVAMVNMEDVSAFWIYHNDTTTGKVLAVK